jgi:hypothetical protein
MVLLAGGALLIATPGMAANTFTTGPATGLGTPGLQQRGLPPGTPEQSTGMDVAAGEPPFCQVPLTFQTIRFCRRTRPAELIRQISRVA